MLDDDGDGSPPAPEKPSKWGRFWRASLWVLGGLALLIWAANDWESAKWAITYGLAAAAIQWWWQDYLRAQEARYFDLRKRLYAQHQILEELRYRIRKLDQDRGAL